MPKICVSGKKGWGATQHRPQNSTEILIICFSLKKKILSVATGSVTTNQVLKSTRVSGCEEYFLSFPLSSGPVIDGIQMCWAEPKDRHIWAGAAGGKGEEGVDSVS